MGTIAPVAIGSLLPLGYFGTKAGKKIYRKAKTKKIWNEFWSGFDEEEIFDDAIEFY